MQFRNSSYAPPNPWQVTRGLLLGSAALTGGTMLIAATLFALISDHQTGLDIVAGTLVALIPQVWFIARGIGRAAGGQATVLALGKFALSGTGFALWFALMPGAGLLATLGGTAASIVLLTVLTVVRLRRPNHG